MMVTVSKPLIVRVHGSWRQQSCFSKLQGIFEEQGYEVYCPFLPTNSKAQSNSSATHLTDVAALHEQILPIFKAGKEAVVVGHSHGAMPGMICMEGYSVDKRAGTPDMKVVKLESGHISFLVMPKRVVEIIVQAADEGEDVGRLERLYIAIGILVEDIYSLFNHESGYVQSRVAVAILSHLQFESEYLHLSINCDSRLLGK